MKGESLLKNLLILCVLVLSACTKPPKGPIGLIGDRGCVMNDLLKDPADYLLSFPECVNHIATTPDYDRILRRAYVECFTPPEGPMCIVGDKGCLCRDNRLRHKDYTLPFKKLYGSELEAWAQSAMSTDELARWYGDGQLPVSSCLNYVVTTADYFRILREYYARRCN